MFCHQRYTVWRASPQTVLIGVLKEGTSDFPYGVQKRRYSVALQQAAHSLKTPPVPCPRPFFSHTMETMTYGDRRIFYCKLANAPNGPTLRPAVAICRFHMRNILKKARNALKCDLETYSDHKPDKLVVVRTRRIGSASPAPSTALQDPSIAALLYWH